MQKKKNSPKIDQAVTQGVSFELTVADMARRSARRAWIVASCAVAVVIILAVAIMLMLPLKQKEPFIVLADPYSGVSQVAPLTDDLVNKRITASEAVNRSNVAHFIIARESFDLAVTNLRDWPTVLTMSAREVANPYIALHSSDNPQRPYNLYGRTKAVRVKILSIQLIGGEGGQTPKGATVRFQRSVYDKTNGATTPLDSKIATMAFVYKPNLRMDDQNRIDNPLGFQVTSYRVDNDYGSAPPPEAPAAPQPQAGADQGQAQPTAGQMPDPADAPSAIPLVPGDTAASQQSGAVPPSPLPADTGAATGQPANAPAQAPTTAAPAARATPPSAANGGRR